MIGERAAWGAGFGFEAWSAVMQALLEREGYCKVTGGAVAANRAMVRVMEKAGMRPDGRRHAHYLIGQPDRRGLLRCLFWGNGNDGGAR